jgi:hypothetical protein
MTRPRSHENAARKQSARRMELVVRGELGPVLRSALRPQATARTERSTVIRLVAPTDADVLAVLQTLHARGLRVTGVRKVGHVLRASPSGTRETR